MFDKDKKRAFTDATVQDLIDVLEALPPKAKILCDGDEWFWVHVSSDLTEVDIDSSELDYAYDDDEET